MHRILCLPLCVEPVRYLTCSFMRANRKYQGKGYPAIMNCVYAAFSPLTHARQFCSSMLAGQSRRLSLLISKAGCSSLGLWASSSLETTKVFRRCLRACSAWIEYRHVQEFMQPPYSLLSLCDERIPLDVREELHERFRAKKPCCYQWGWHINCGRMSTIC